VEGEIGYYLWDLVNHNIVKSVDVIFNELEMYKRVAGDVNKIVDNFIEE